MSDLDELTRTRQSHGSNFCLYELPNEIAKVIQLESGGEVSGVISAVRERNHFFRLTVFAYGD
jgi:hypothetical protein